MRRLIAAVAASALLAGAGTTAALTGAPAAASAPQPGDAPSGWEPRPAKFGVHVTEDVAVQMSDGAVLRVNVYRPAKADGTPVERRFPVILTQTP